MDVQRSIVCAIRLLFIILNNIYGTLCYIALYVAFFPVKILFPKIFRKCEKVLYENLVGMVAMWGALSNHKLVCSGEDVLKHVEDEAIVLVNHQTPTDIAVMMHFLYGIKGALQSCMWVMDWILMFSNAGIVAKGHGDFFLLQLSDFRKFRCLFGRTTEEEIKVSELERLKLHTVRVFKEHRKKWVVLFPEGGFLHKRKAGSHRYAVKHNLPKLENVVLPRSGAVEAIINALNNTDEKIKYIIDVTLAYDNQTIGFGDWVFGNNKNKTISLHVKIFPISELYQNGHKEISSSHVDQWLTKLYIEKDSMLAKFKTTKQFTDDSRVLSFPYKSCVLCHLLSIAISYLAIKCLFL